MDMKILIIEDDRILGDTLQNLLQKNEYETELAADGEKGLQMALSGEYDLIVTDVMLPGINGYLLTRTLRERKCTVPVLMLTARSDLLDRVNGLNSGADYYLTKPFDSRELLACVHALLRRSVQEEGLSFGNTSLDESTGILQCEGKEIRLSARELDVMKLLLQAQSKNLSKEALLTAVWGYDSNATENTVEVYIGFLRKKLQAIHSNVKIVAIRRLGYHLEVSTS